MPWCKTAVTPGALEMELLQPCSKPSMSIYIYIYVNNRGLVSPYRRLSYMRVSLAAYREPVGSYNRLLDWRRY